MAQNALDRAPAESRSWGDYRDIARLASPILVASIWSTISGLTDTAMMGRYSMAGLAGVAAAVAILTLFWNMVVAATTGHQILSAKHFGAGDPAGAGQSLAGSLVFAGSLAVLATAVLMIAPAPLMRLMTESDDVVREGVRFLLGRAPGLLMSVATALLIVTLNSDRQTRWALYVSIVAAATNISLDFVLIFGLGFVPPMGSFGNGLSSTIADAMALITLCVIASRQGLFRRMRLWDALMRRPEIGAVRDLSLPAMISMALDYLGNVVIFAIIGAVGLSALASGRIVFSVLLLMFLVTAAFGTACQILVGRAWGAKDVAAAGRYRRRTAELTVTLGGVLSLPLLMWPEAVIRVFTSFPRLQHGAVGAVRIVAICIPIMGVAAANVGVLRALGRTTADMWVNIVAVWLVQIPVAYFLGITGKAGLIGIFGGFAAYWLARAALTQLLLLSARPDRLAAREIPT